MEFFKFADEIRRSPFIQESDHEFWHGTGFYRGTAGFIDNFPSHEIHPQYIALADLIRIAFDQGQP